MASSDDLAERFRESGDGGGLTQLIEGLLACAYPELTQAVEVCTHLYNLSD